MKKILFIINDSKSLINFRGDLIRYLSKDYAISAILPKNKLNKKIENDFNIKIFEVDMIRFFSTFKDLICLLQIINIFIFNRFDIVHTITIKPNIYGMIGSFLFVKKRIAMVTGAGSLFNERRPIKGKIRKNIAIRLYKLGLFLSNYTIFQNQDDIDDFVRLGIINKDKCKLIDGSGVDKKYYNKNINFENKIQNIQNKFKINNKKVVLSVARMIESKGVKKFARISNNFKDSNIIFILIAPFDYGYNLGEMVNSSDISKYQNNNLIIIDKYVEDIRPFLKMSKVSVLLSTYREGIPKFLIESLAFSLPIVTYNTIGCKETVINEKNGYKFNIDESDEKIVSAIKKIINNSKINDIYSKKSYELFLKKFESKIIIKKITDLYI